MRTTLDIDEDVLQAAKEIARREKKTTGQVISTLARRVWVPPRCPAGPHRVQRLIDELRDDDAY